MLFQVRDARFAGPPQLLTTFAGIHGLPNAPWDNVGDKWDGSPGGYCAHGVLTFPTWHRPYLALFEQTIYLKMVDIAKTYNEPHRSRYTAACKEFRLPYFDYFRPRGGRVEFPGVVAGRTTSFPYDFRLPDIFNVQKVTILTAPDDVADPNFDNPLYAYKFSDATGRLPRRDEDSIVSAVNNCKPNVKLMEMCRAACIR